MSDTPALITALKRVIEARVRLKNAFEDERAALLLPLAKSIPPDANIAELINQRPAFAAREAANNARTSVLNEFEQMIEQVIRRLLRANDAEVRKFLEDERSRLLAVRATPEGAEVIAAQLDALDRLLGTTAAPARKVTAAAARSKR